MSLGRTLPFMTFETYCRTIFHRAPPPVICFAQGTQFAATRAALRRVPRSTYEELRRLIHDEKRTEVSSRAFPASIAHRHVSGWLL